MGDPDVVYVHPKTGGKLFIGAHTAASEIKILEKHQIFNIVNCKGSDGENFFEEVYLCGERVHK